MKWLLLVTACGSSSPRDDVSERVANMQAVKTPFTLEVMTLDSTSADRAKQFETELRAAAREYSGVTVRVSGKHLIDEKLMTSCEAEAPACMAAIAKGLPADRMIYGRLDRARVELHLVIANNAVVSTWATDQLGTGDAGLRVTAREAIQALLTR